MESHWAAEHLQVIRTLMERSAVYRRALAPVMTTVGLIGTLASVLACFIETATARAFSLFWMGTSLAGLLAAVFLVRRQALQEGEAFWSPPTRRVTQALLPPFAAGLAGGLAYAGLATPALPIWLLPALWMAAYGCGLHAAGFFMQRGIRWLGWVFVLCAIAWGLVATWVPVWQSIEAAHYVMGIVFGAGQLVYGGYLYLTEKRKSAP